MNNRRLRFARYSLLVLTFALAACGSTVAIKTGSLDGGCYMSGVTGELAADPAAGTAITDGMSGQRVAVTWPVGWTGRQVGSEVEVLNQSGEVKARTGSRVSLMGGYWTDGSFLTCGPVP